MTVSVAGLPNAQLKGAGKQFVADFQKATGEAPDPYSVYAAQAADVLLTALEKSDGKRGDVAAKLFESRTASWATSRSTRTAIRRRTR